MSQLSLLLFFRPQLGSHIKIAVDSQNILKVCEQTTIKITDQTGQIVSALENCFEECAVENGHMTADQMAQLLNEFKQSVQGEMASLQEEIRNSAVILRMNENANDSDPEISNHEIDTACRYTWKLFPHLSFSQNKQGQQKFFQVLQEFQFPVGATLKVGWCMWLMGMPNFVVASSENSTWQHPSVPSNFSRHGHFQNMLDPPGCFPGVPSFN